LFIILYVYAYYIGIPPKSTLMEEKKEEDCQYIMNLPCTALCISECLS